MGRPKTVNEQYLNRLKELVSNSPRDCGYSFDRWTGQWLSKQLAKELGIEISSCHVNRLLKQMGLSTRSESTIKEAEKRSDSEKSNLLIRDLVSTAVSESSEIMWQFNSLN